MKPVVVQSINDENAQRCVDIVRQIDGRFGWSECRRDPEDAHGWRHLAGPADGAFLTVTAAWTDARRATPRLAQQLTESADI
jgi:hypothetical protein